MRSRSCSRSGSTWSSSYYSWYCRWCFRAVTGNGVVAAGGSLCRLHHTHSDRVRIVAWSRDGAVTFRARAVIAALVASRSNDDDARTPSGLDSLAERIERITLEDLAAKRKVDHSDVVRRLQADGRLDRRNYTAVGTGAVLV